MTAVFESILHMSAVASIVILTVIVLRFCLKSAPKKFSYILWAVVLVRLLCPVMPESALSTMPRNNGAVELLEDWEDDYVGTYHTYHDIRPEYDAAVAAGIEPIYMPGGGSYVNLAPDGVSPAPTVKTERMPILSVIWLCGIAAMAAWAVIDYLRLRYRLRTAVREEKGVYMTDAVDSPFVLGLFRPKIYLPAVLGESEREYILLHERCHIRRGDHWIKLLAFAALALHWFNPLVWLAFMLANRDMEMSCDEAVIKSLGAEVRADYSASLLALATGRRRVSVTPLAFGEGDPKGRIRNLANWRKPTVWIIIVAVLVCIVAAVCLLTDPVSHKAQIRVYDSVFTYSGKERDITALPPGAIDLGELKGVVHNTEEEPAENFYGTNLDAKYAGQPLLLPDNRTLYLYDEEGFYLVFELEEGYDIPEIPVIEATEVARGDFDRDGRADYIEVSQSSPVSETLRVRLIDAKTGTVLWTEDASPAEDGQKCIIHRVGEDGLDYLIVDSYAAAEDKVHSRTIYIVDGREKVVERSESDLVLPETDSEAEFIELMSLSLPQNSTVLLSTLGGITVVGPVNRPAEASPTEVARGDFDHDGVEETVMIVPDGQYGDMWDLCVTDPDGKVIWAEENFHTSHPGWNSILSTSIAGRDYLVRYNPYMSTGIARYVCEVFYIKFGAEVTVQEWSAEFYSSYNPPMEITSEMAEFATAVNDLAPRCTILFSTLDGEVLTGPVSAVESGIMTVDYLLDHCRGLVQQVGWSDYYSFESKQFIGGELGSQPEYPAISAWVCGDDWLYISESVAADGGVTRQIDIQKDGRHYVWLSIPMGESVHETDPEGYDQYFWWLKNGSLGTHLSFESELRSSDGLTLNYVELFETEAGTVGSGTHSYVLDENGALESYSATSSGVTRTVTFPAVSEAMCRQKIEEAYAELSEALEQETLSPISIYGLENGLCDGSFGLRWGTKESHIASQSVYKTEPLSSSQTRYDYAGVANLCFADVPCSFSAHCTDGVLSGISMSFTAKSGEQVKTIEKVYKLLKQSYGDVDAVYRAEQYLSQPQLNGRNHLEFYGAYAGRSVWNLENLEGGDVQLRLSTVSEMEFLLELLPAAELKLAPGVTAEGIRVYLGGGEGRGCLWATAYGDSVLADLDGDGVTELICQTAARARLDTLTINGKDHSDEVYAAIDYISNINSEHETFWYIADFYTGDKKLHICVYDSGPSSDPVTHFFGYENGSLVYLGSVPVVASGLLLHGDGRITGLARLDVFQTWYAEHEWKVSPAYLSIDEVVYDSYMVGSFEFISYTIGQEYFPPSKKNPLLCDVWAYSEPDLDAEREVLKEGTKLSIVGTDNREWLILSDGQRLIYFHLSGPSGTKIDTPDGEIMGLNVFHGLWYFD